jgi:hypothetical protein
MSQRRERRQQARERRRQRSPRGWTARRDLLLAAGLALLAWVHRIFFLHSNRDTDWPHSIFYAGDTEAFFGYARSLLAGQLYDNGIPFHPPGFAWVLAGVHALTGAGAGAERISHFAVKAALALLGSLPVGLLYLLVKPYLGRTVALLAALLSLYHFGLYVLAVTPVTEGTYLALLLLALLFWTRRFEHPLAAPVPEGEPPLRSGAGGALLLGLLLGFLALVRAEAALIGLLLGAVGLAGAFRRRRQGSTLRAALRPWALVLAGWLLAVAPWTARNAVRLSEMNERYAGRFAEPLPTFVPLTLYGPINLALANNPMADGTFSRDWLASRMEAGVLDLQDPQHLEFILHGDRMAFEWARENPGDFLRLVGRKWVLFLSAWKLGWTQWNAPGGLDGLVRRVDVFVPESPAALWIGPPLALLGLFVCLRSPGPPRRWVLVVAIPTFVGLVATGLFFGYVRQGLLLMPLWLTFPAAALAALGNRLRLPVADPPRRLLQALAAVAVLLFLLEAWGASRERTFKMTGTILQGRMLDWQQPVVLEAQPE